MNSLRKILASKYGLVAHIMHDDYFFVQLPENEDHSLKFLESNLPECIRVELAECFAGSVIAAWEVPLFLLPQVLQQAHDFIAEYWEQISQETGSILNQPKLTAIHFHPFSFSSLQTFKILTIEFLITNYKGLKSWEKLNVGAYQMQIMVNLKYPILLNQQRAKFSVNKLNPHIKDSIF